MRGIRLVRPGFESLVLIALGAWGVYGVITVSTSPAFSSTEGLVGDVLQKVQQSMGLNETVNGVAYFTAIFQANPHYDSSKGWPQVYPVPGGQGIAWGPFLPSEPSSAVFPFVKRFAVFIVSLSASGTSVSWGIIGGPNSNGQPTSPSSFVYSSGIGISPAVLIVQADAPGNYSLSVASANGRVVGSMGYSSLTFTPSRPFFYLGLATLIVAGVYFSTRLFSFLKRPRDKKPDHQSVREPVPVGVPLD